MIAYVKLFNFIVVRALCCYSVYNGLYTLNHIVKRSIIMSFSFCENCT